MMVQSNSFVFSSRLQPTENWSNARHSRALMPSICLRVDGLRMKKLCATIFRRLDSTRTRSFSSWASVAARNSSNVTFPQFSKSTLIWTHATRGQRRVRNKRCECSKSVQTRLFHDYPHALRRDLCAEAVERPLHVPDIEAALTVYVDLIEDDPAPRRELRVFHSLSFV